MGDELLLRGGTALNLFHLDLPRLLVDIDLDFVGAADAEQAQARRPERLAELEALARSAGIEALVRTGLAREHPAQLGSRHEPHAPAACVVRVEQSRCYELGIDNATWCRDDRAPTS